MSSSSTTPELKKGKIKILPSKRKHRHDIKKINELTLPENYPMELWESIISEHCSFVLMNNSVMIGYCCVAKKSVMSFAILPEYRGQGLGKTLMLHTLNYLKSQKWEYITLHVRTDNIIAQKLYLSVGFENDVIVDKYYGDIDAHKMKKIF